MLKKTKPKAVLCEKKKGRGCVIYSNKKKLKGKGILKKGKGWKNRKPDVIKSGKVPHCARLEGQGHEKSKETKEENVCRKPCRLWRPLSSPEESLRRITGSYNDLSWPHTHTHTKRFFEVLNIHLSSRVHAQLEYHSNLYAQVCFTQTPCNAPRARPVHIFGTIDSNKRLWIFTKLLKMKSKGTLSQAKAPSGQQP